MSATTWFVTYETTEWAFPTREHALVKLYSLKTAVARPAKLVISERPTTGFEAARWA